MLLRRGFLPGDDFDVLRTGGGKLSGRREQLLRRAVLRRTVLLCDRTVLYAGWELLRGNVLCGAVLWGHW